MDIEVKPAPPELADILQVHHRQVRGGWRAAVTWLIAVGAAALALALYASGRPPAIQYFTAEVTTGSLTVTVSAAGHLRPRNQVDVGSEISGTVESVHVNANSPVHAGQLLASLDRARLKAELSQAESALAVAEARVIQRNASLHAAAAFHARLVRVRQLSGNKLPSQQDMDVAEARFARAQGEAAAAYAAVAQAQAARETVRTDLAKTEIRSPIDGVVLVRSIEPGQTVAASLQAPVLFTLAGDLRQMELHVALDEADVGSVQIGQPATFTVDAFTDHVFDAKIARIHLASNQTQTVSSGMSLPSQSFTAESSGVVTYETVLDVSNPELLLRPGMTATAEIATNVITNITLVPNTAMRFTPRDAQVPGVDDDPGRTGLVALMPYLAEPWKCPKENGQALGCVWILESGKPVLAVFKPGATDRRQTQVLGLARLPNWSSLSQLRNDPILTKALARELRPGMDVIVSGQERPQ